MKYIMLTGHRKSGTSLFHSLFDGHDGINVYPVDLSVLYAFFPAWVGPEHSEEQKSERLSLVMRKSLAQVNGKRVSASIERFDSESFLEHVFDRLNPEEFNRPSQILRCVAEAYCTYAGLDKSLPFLFKETSQTVNLAGMLADGVDVTAVQLIRDPRDNYAAIKAGVSDYYHKMGESEQESLASVLNRARMDLELALLKRADGPEVLIPLRFEDLVSQPSKEMEDLMGKLNIPWSESLRKPTRLGEPYAGNSHDGMKFSAVSKANMGRWRSRITDHEACVIEAWMRHVMEQWGYELVYSDVDHARALEKFYAWYNLRYFYRDSFAVC